MSCMRYQRALPQGPAPYCTGCGGETVARVEREIEEDLGKLGFLVAEVELWLRNGAVAAEVRAEIKQTILPEYELQLELASAHRSWLAGSASSFFGASHQGADRNKPALEDFARRADADADADAVSDPASAPVSVLPFPHDEPSVLVAPSLPAEHYEAPASHDLSGAGRLMQEVRPLVYENFILFLGAFLVFSGSLYFAIYFWERLGSFGPLVAGSLLGVYASGFASMGYLLQRRYRAELSARVLFGIATAIYPIAVTLAGEPLALAGPEGPGFGLLPLASAAAVTLWTAAAAPAITVASSLFQREIARPFTRAFLALLFAIGFAPLLLSALPRPAAVGFLYLAALPLAAMYRRVREIGRVYEPETVVYVVAGSAYLLLAIAVRVALLTAPALTLPELAPLAVLLATAAIDLDVEWRRGPRGVRSALGSVGVLAHAVTVVAVVLAFAHPGWRVVTTLGAGALFAIAALRHRRPSALHLALATLTLGLLLSLWLPPLAPHSWQPRALGFAGAILLPWSLALTKLAARWRKNAAPEYAAPVEHWVLICAVLTALATLAPLEDALRLWHGPSELLSAGLAALLMLPATVVTQLIAWRWSRRPAYLTFATSLAVMAALVACRLVGLRHPALTLLASGLTLLVALAGLRARRDEARAGLRDAAIGLYALSLAAIALLRGVEMALPFAVELLALLLLGGAALAIAAARPGWRFGVLAMLTFSAAATLALLQLLPAQLIAGVLALALLAVHRLAAAVQLGQAQPFRHAQALAGCALAGHSLHLLSHGDEQFRGLPIAEPALVVTYAIARWRLGGHPLAVRCFAHLAFAAFALTGLAATHALHLQPGPRGMFLLGGFALVAAELLARRPIVDARNPIAARAAFDWSAGALLACGVTSAADLPRLTIFAPLSAVALVVCLRRAHRHQHSPLYILAGPWRVPILSAACVLAAQHVAVYLLSLGGLLEREAFTLAALALVTALAGWAHWTARVRLGFDDAPASRFASVWLALAALVAVFSGSSVALAFDDTALAVLTLSLAGVWFTRAAVRDERAVLGTAAWLSFFAILFRLRLSPLAAALPFATIADLDAVILVALAFSSHLIGELLQRARLNALARPSALFVVALPLLAAFLALTSHHPASALRHALLFESIGVVYLLSFWRGGPRPLAFVAACFVNAGLFLLWIHTDQRDPLFYTLPAGASIAGLARLYRDNLGPGARRGLHFAGCLLIYFSTYYRVVQFDSGLYPILLGGLTLAGVALGFALQLRDLFLMSAGFLVLNVISNLAFYGVHRPLLGWTLLTVAGLGLTAAGVVFQLRRAELTALLNRIRANLHAWD